LTLRRLWVVLIIYPTIYYITHPTMDYRHGIDPLIVVLAVYAVQMRKHRLPGNGNKSGDQSRRGTVERTASPEGRDI
jgi:hypothetical protein